MYISNKVKYDKDGNLRELEVSVFINDQSVKLSQFSDGNLRSVLREFLLKETLISKEEIYILKNKKGTKNEKNYNHNTGRIRSTT